jgi:hypothetical protein
MTVLRESNLESKSRHSCRHCGKRFVPPFRAGRNTRRSRPGRERALTAAQFCSARCKQANYRWRQSQDSGPNVLSAVTGGSHHIDVKGEFSTFSIAGRGITGPADVINAELWDRHSWEPAVSSGGTRIEVGRLRSRALVS